MLGGVLAMQFWSLLPKTTAVFNDPGLYNASHVASRPPPSPRLTPTELLRNTCVVHAHAAFHSLMTSLLILLAPELSVRIENTDVQLQSTQNCQTGTYFTVHNRKQRDEAQ